MSKQKRRTGLRTVQPNLANNQVSQQNFLNFQFVIIQLQEKKRQ